METPLPQDPLSMTDPIDIAPAVALAQALDREDYPLARRRLRDDCIYQIRGEVIHGAEAIIDSYRSAGDGGRERFDSLSFESKVHEIGRGQARIDYTDIVTRSGDQHVHRCSQVVEIGDDGLISRIEHVDLDGEREALEAFKASHP
ncbi:MAG: hypothetical protein ACR2RV_29120 [Verrucomicrobiales bacterium]